MSWLRRIRYPFPYWGSFGGALLWLFEKNLEQWFPSWWPSSLPWGWITVCFLCVVIGQAMSDIENPYSWIVRKWNYWKRYFDVQGQYYTSEVRNGRNYLHLSVRITFVKNVTDADLFLKVYQLGFAASHQFTRILDSHINIKKDAQITHILAVVPIEAGENAYWGSPTNPTTSYLVEGGRYIAMLCLRNKNSYQEFKIYIEMATPKAHNFGRFFVFDERYTFLDFLTKPTTESRGILLVKNSYT